MSFAIYLFVTTLWLILVGVGCYSLYYYQDKLGRVVEVKTPVRTAVIIPVRGVPGHMDAMIEALFCQTYPTWRLIFAVESEDDPVYPVLKRLQAGETNPVPISIVVAGHATDSAQKVHNQFAAAATLTPDDEAIVFADADIVPTPDWLMRLVVGLENQSIAMVSGYRWLIPERNNLATLVVCAINNAIATLPRIRQWNHAWGGSMAVRRETLDGMGLLPSIRGCLTDDLTLTRTIRAHGSVVIGPRELLVPTYVSYTWRGGFQFARRQYHLVRFYAPKLWLFAAGIVTVSLLGWVLALSQALAGHPLAMAQIGIAVVLEQVRAQLRHRVVKTLWGDEGLAAGRSVLRLMRWGTPFNLLWHACVLWSSAVGRTVLWAGRVYRVLSPYRLVIVSGPSGSNKE